MTLSAIYEQALHAQFVAEMRGAATEEPTGTKDKGLNWTLRFSQRAAYDTARAELERLDLLKFATFDDDAASVEFPQTAKTPHGNINILARLGLDPPQVGWGRLIAAPRASEAPGYAQAIGHGLAVRVDEYGLKQGDG